MKRILLYAAVLGAAALAAHAATPVYVTPDVPTDETLSGLTLLPSEIYRYDGAGYVLELAVPGSPDLNAIHKLDTAGDWLFSVEAPSDLGGALLPVGSTAEPRDLVYYDASAGTYTLCFTGASVGLTPGTSVDSVTLEGGDATCGGGDLLLSFDIPTELGPFTGASAFEPGDLVRFAPLGPGACPGWSLTAANPAFDASAAGAGVAISINTDGADTTTGKTFLALDIPSLLSPPVQPDFTPGVLVETDSVTFTPFETLLGWPISSVVDGMSCSGNPGAVPVTMTVNKAAFPATDLVITWSSSCSGGAEDYGIHEGTLGTWYSHTAIDCSDAGGDLTEQVSPNLAADTYYLVVPHNACKGEGSYGKCNTGVCLGGDERPVASTVCAAPQVITCCP